MNFKTTIMAMVILLQAYSCSRWEAAYENWDAGRTGQSPLVIASLSLKSGDRVADFNAGGGFYTFALAEKAGMVYAVEARAELLELIKEVAEEKNISNITTITRNQFVSCTDGEVVDLIFIKDGLNLLDHPEKMLKGLGQCLGADGRIAIIEDKEKTFPGAAGFFPEDKIRNIMEEAGFVMIERYGFLEKKSFTIFRKSSD